MRLNRRVVRGIQVLVVVFLVWAVTGISLNARRVEAVVATLSPGGVEHRDKVVLGIGAADEPPDYGVRVRTRSGWEDLGTHANTWIGGGLEFRPSESIRVSAVREVQLVDRDKLENDVLEQAPLNDHTIIGRNYTLEVRTTFDLESGFGWFFQTPVGLAILFGIGVAVAIIVLANAQL
jgi:hypothetical protein